MSLYDHDFYQWTQEQAAIKGWRAGAKSITDAYDLAIFKPLFFINTTMPLPLSHFCWKIFVNLESIYPLQLIILIFLTVCPLRRWSARI